MQCKFIQHGLAISYDQVVKPCCAWHYDNTYKQENHINLVNLAEWHSSAVVLKTAELLNQDKWPKNCHECKDFETQGRGDSMRGNGNSAYADYSAGDITLELRPGNTCNFACQTCWPEASSRVLEFHKKAGLVTQPLDTNKLDDFEFLMPIRDRIKNVVLLGGEPFYDKSCIKFLAWAKDNLSASITMFTNASHIDWEFIKSYPEKLIVVVSLDAVGKAAEYVRFGTVWDDVYSNYLKLKEFSNVEVRVNITTSVWNYRELESLLTMLSQDWPSMVTYGKPRNSYQLENSIPVAYREELISSLQRTVYTLNKADIPTDQKVNSINTVSSIIRNLKEDNFIQADFDYLKTFVASMDKVKNIKSADYCDFFANMLS